MMSSSDMKVQSNCDMNESDSCLFLLNESSTGSGSACGSNHQLVLVLPEDEDPELVQQDERFECPVCIMYKSSHRLLRNPVQIRCGHRMCETCVEVYLGEELSKKCPLNEDDCEQVSRDTIVPDLVCRREIKQLKVYCCYHNNGCQADLKLAMLEKHKAECAFKNVQCTYLSRGCTESVLLKYLESHLAVCEYQPAVCEFCGTKYSLINKQKHDTAVCPEGIVSCPYLCGQTGLKRRQLQDHKNICPRKPEYCRFKSLGCTFTGSFTELRGHEQNVTTHFHLFIECFTSFKIQAQDQKKEIEAFKQQSVEHARWKEKIENIFNNMHEELKLKMVQQMELFIFAEQKVSELAAAVAHSSQQSENILQSIEQLKTLIPQVTKHDKDIASLNTQMAAMNKKFQIVNTTNYDGTLFWKICDYSKKKKDAEVGHTKTFISQPFYTSQFGYKMSCKVYLNGCGTGLGTHMSLYIVIMRGDYDALLPWPFQCKVSFAVLDQSPEKNHIKKEFTPDPKNKSYKQPLDVEKNEPCGYNCFVSHEVLENKLKNYVKDDVIFIKIFIDSTNLKPI